MVSPPPPPPPPPPPSPSDATAARRSRPCPAHASTTAPRMRSCTARIGSSRCAASLTSAPLRVVHARDRPQLGRRVLRGGVVQEVAAADLRASEVLEQPGLAQRRMDLNMKVKSGVGRSIGGRLVQHHHVR